MGVKTLPLGSAPQTGSPPANVFLKQPVAGIMPSLPFLKRSRRAATFQLYTRTKPLSARPISRITNIPAISRVIQTAPRSLALFVPAGAPKSEDVTVAACQCCPISQHRFLPFVAARAVAFSQRFCARPESQENHAKMLPPEKEGGEAPKGACQPRCAHPLRDALAFRRLAAALPFSGIAANQLQLRAALPGTAT